MCALHLIAAAATAAAAAAAATTTQTPWRTRGQEDAKEAKKLNANLVALLEKHRLANAADALAGQGIMSVVNLVAEEERLAKILQLKKPEQRRWRKLVKDCTQLVEEAGEEDDDEEEGETREHKNDRQQDLDDDGPMSALDLLPASTLAATPEPAAAAPQPTPRPERKEEQEDEERSGDDYLSFLLEKTKVKQQLNQQGHQQGQQLQQQQQQQQQQQRQHHTWGPRSHRSRGPNLRHSTQHAAVQFSAASEKLLTETRKDLVSFCEARETVIYSNSH